MIKNTKTKIITIILEIYTYQTKNYYVKLQNIIEMKKMVYCDHIYKNCEIPKKPSV